jgi:SAM-dependent methyltransferase
MRWIDGVREAAVTRLALQPGEIVGDIGCGTGFCLPALSQAVGFGGKVIGIEPTPAMLAWARTRTAGFSNVVLIQSPAETAHLSVAPDALLFSFAHDVLQSHAALENILAQAKVGARIVAVGFKLFPWVLNPRNLWFLAKERNYITTYRGISQPWHLLAQYLDEFTVLSLSPGNKYLVFGRLHSLPSVLQAE